MILVTFLIVKLLLPALVRELQLFFLYLFAFFFFLYLYLSHPPFLPSSSNKCFIWQQLSRKVKDFIRNSKVYLEKWTQSIHVLSIRSIQLRVGYKKKHLPTQRNHHQNLGIREMFFFWYWLFILSLWREMSEYAHFHTLSHHQLQSCRHISCGLPPAAVSENQAAVG